MLRHMQELHNTSLYQPSFCKSVVLIHARKDAFSLKWNAFCCFYTRVTVGSISSHAAIEPEFETALC